MDVRSAVLKMIASVNGSWSVAAAYLGMTENSLRNRAYETKGQALSTYDKLSLQQLSGTTLFAEAVAAESGGTFVKLPDIGDVENDSIQAMFNQNYAELGAMFSTFTAAIVDGEIDEKERAQLQGQGEQLHRKTEMLLALMFSVYCRRTNTVKMEHIAREAANV
jgi:hypothetical protein